MWINHAYILLPNIIIISYSSLPITRPKNDARLLLTNIMACFYINSYNFLFQVPVGIGPCADPIYAEKTLSKKLVPLFNRTTRFPCFSSKTLPGSGQLRPSVPRKAASVQVTTKYSNGFFARCFLCCTTAEDS